MNNKEIKDFFLSIPIYLKVIQRISKKGISKYVQKLKSLNLRNFYQYFISIFFSTDKSVSLLNSKAIRAHVVWSNLMLYYSQVFSFSVGWNQWPLVRYNIIDTWKKVIVVGWHPFPLLQNYLSVNFQLKRRWLRLLN